MKRPSRLGGHVSGTAGAIDELMTDDETKVEDYRGHPSSSHWIIKNIIGGHAINIYGKCLGAHTRPSILHLLRVFSTSLSTCI